MNIFYPLSFLHEVFFKLVFEKEKLLKLQGNSPHLNGVIYIYMEMETLNFCIKGKGVELLFFHC